MNKGLEVRSNVENWTDYGGTNGIPYGPRLSSYFLHTPEWREAFLERLVAVGDVALLEATARVYDLLDEPKDQRCATIAKAAGVSGEGKVAILHTLQAFLDNWLLPTPPLPPIENFDELSAWHEAVISLWASENEREKLVVEKFAAALDGSPLPQSVQ